MIGDQRTFMPGIVWGPTAAGAFLAVAVATIALVLARSGRAGEGLLSDLLLPAGLGVIAAAGWFMTLVLRDNEKSLRVITATVGFVVLGGFALIGLGALGAEGARVREFYRPTTAAGSAGLWLIVLATAPFSAASALEYRRSDPWYSWPMVAVMMTWLAMIVITALDIFARLDG